MGKMEVLITGSPRCFLSLGVPSFPPERLPVLAGVVCVAVAVVFVVVAGSRDWIERGSSAWKVPSTML